MTCLQALATELGKPCGAMVRTAEELAAVVAKNPFKKVEPTRVVVFFLDEAREAAAMGSVKTPGKEDLGLVGARSDGEGDGGLRA